MTLQRLVGALLLAAASLAFSLAVWDYWIYKDSFTAAFFIFVAAAACLGVFANRDDDGRA